ncbi:MAG: FAD-dependent oxidoreductase [Gemmatimonadetes bacterium]|nr:FAD-dependent oxidoreductase [Gemmatimonadota bacterium]|tara:strand:+ start:424 stop:1653 length:1230 start_codon:yes stop_codon:yes gene_type:complete
MKIAIVGGGISGLTTAYLLSREHEVILYESNDYIGGHTNTVTIEMNGSPVAVDTGFIVYNEQNYPNFSHILSDLNVSTQPTSMSFSVKLIEPDLEYNGSSFKQLFGQKKNLLRPRFYQMLWDILRFNRQAPGLLESNSYDITLGEHAIECGFSQDFIHHYLVPMGAAIWSSSPSAILEMPAYFFIRFFKNHGMLNLNDRPQWRTITGGSCQYVNKMIASFAKNIRLGHKVSSVERLNDRVTVDGDSYDHVVFACHSDQAIEALSDPSVYEKDILSKISYQKNEIIMHTDTSIMPAREDLWAAWNYHSQGNDDSPVAMTYNMNILQDLDMKETICITLNSLNLINPDLILGRHIYSHPQFTTESMKAQERWMEISGGNRTHFCGAYWGNGFHEDGVNSALRIANFFGIHR